MKKSFIVITLLLAFSSLGYYYTFASSGCYGDTANSKSGMLMVGDCQVPTSGSGRYYFQGSADYEYTEYGQDASNPVVGSRPNSNEVAHCDSSISSNNSDFSSNCCPGATGCSRPTTSGNQEIHYQSRPTYTQYKRDGTLSVSGNLVNAGEATYMQENSSIRDKDGSKMNMSSDRNSVETPGQLKVGDSMVFDNARGQINVGKSSISKAGSKRMVMTDFGSRDDTRFDQMDAESIDGVDGLGQVTAVANNEDYFFYTDKSSRQVVRMDENGNAQTFGGSAWDWSPEGIEVNSDHVFVASGEVEGSSDMFRVTAPAHNANYDAGANIMISWTKISSAHSYNIIHEDSKGNKKELSVLSKSTSYDFHVGPEYNGLNYFSVTAHDENGRIINKTNNNVPVYIGGGGNHLDFRMLTPSHGSKFEYNQHVRFSWTKPEGVDEYYLFCMREGSDNDLGIEEDDDSDDNDDEDEDEEEEEELDFGFDVQTSTGYNNETFLITGDGEDMLSDGYYKCKAYAMEYENGIDAGADGSELSPIGATADISIEIRGGLRLPPDFSEENYEIFCETHVCAADRSMGREYYYGENVRGGKNGSNNISSFDFPEEGDLEEPIVNSFHPDPTNLKAVESFNIVKEYMENPDGTGFVDAKAMSFSNPKGMSSYKGYLYVADSSYNRIVKISSSLYTPLDLSNDLMRIKAENGKGWQSSVVGNVKESANDYWKVLDIRVDAEDDEEDSGNSPVYLWKPASEADGQLAVLLPASFPDSCSVTVDGEVGAMRDGRANGNRLHYRFSGLGSSYSGVAEVNCDGYSITFTAPDPNERHLVITQYEGPEPAEPEEGEEGEPGAGGSKLRSPQDVLVNDVGMFVANTGDGSLYWLGGGSSEWRIIKDRSLAWAPSSLYMDGDTLHVTDGARGRVIRINIPAYIDRGMINGDTYHIFGRKGTEAREFTQPAGVAKVGDTYLIPDTYGNGGQAIDTARSELLDTVRATSMGNAVGSPLTSDIGPLLNLVNISNREEQNKFVNDANSNVRVGDFITSDVYTRWNGSEDRLTNWEHGAKVSHCSEIPNEVNCNAGTTNSAESTCTGTWDLEPIISECVSWTSYACCTTDRDGIEGEEYVSETCSVVINPAGSPMLLPDGLPVVPFCPVGSNELNGSCFNSVGAIVTSAFCPTGSIAVNGFCYYEDDVMEDQECGSFQCTQYCCVPETRSCAVGVSIDPGDYASAPTPTIGDGTLTCDELNLATVQGWPIENPTTGGCE